MQSITKHLLNLIYFHENCHNNSKWVLVDCSLVGPSLYLHGHMKYECSYSVMKGNNYQGRSKHFITSGMGKCQRYSLSSKICVGCLPHYSHFYLHLQSMQSQDSSVSIVTTLWDGQLVFDSWQGQGFFSSQPCPEWLWGPPSLLFNGYWGGRVFSQG